MSKLVVLTHWGSDPIGCHGGPASKMLVDDVTFCCDEMKEAWEKKQIGIELSTGYSAYVAKEIPHGNETIDHCPFCGAKIKQYVEGSVG